MKFSVVAAVLFCVGAAWGEDCGPLKIFAQIDLVPGANAEYVPVEIAGTTKLLLLDTGSARSMITEQTANELGLKQKHVRSRFYGVTGQYSDTMVAAPITLGGLKGGNFDFFVAPPDFAAAEPRMAGLLGADVLAQFDVSIDFATNKLDLIGQDHCDGQVVFWKERPLAIVPFRRLQSGHIVLPVTLDGQKIDAMLDTGASRSTLNQPVAETTYGLKVGSDETPAVGVLNGEKGSTVWRHTFHTLTFEGVTVQNPLFGIIPNRMGKHFDDKELGSLISHPNEQVEPDVLLGMNVLKHLHVYIAYKEKKLYITPASVTTQSAASAN